MTPSPSLIRGVVFDRDGVLTRFDLPALRAYFEPLLPIDIEGIATRWQRWCGRGVTPRTLADEAGFWTGFWDAIADELSLSAAVRAQLHAFDYTHVFRIYPDVLPAIEAARARGLRVGVLSNFPLVSLEASLAAVGLLGAVDVARSAAMIGAAKPAAEAYLHVASALGVSPHECVMFDDEAPCVGGAREVGMRAFLVDRRRDTHALDAGIVRDLSALGAVVDAAARARG